VNLLGVFHSLKHELGAMESGAIVNLSPVLGQAGYEQTCAYITAKPGVSDLPKAAAVEYADRCGRANAVCPGLTRRRRRPF
jgi:NAD(P)-dependent dehydrogenase (short-subunit alcohol dehydrogenase family)